MLALTCDVDPVFEQSEDDPEKPLHDRYVKNAAALPELQLPHSDRALTAEEKTSSGTSSNQLGPLMIHGFTVAEYQQMYHSVVDPLLFRACGKLTAYSLQLGGNIKEHLFAALAYPVHQISYQPNGRVEVVERFCVLRPTPFINVNATEELNG